MVTDYNDASGTNAFELSSLSWSEKILDAVEIPNGMMPEAVKYNRADWRDYSGGRPGYRSGHRNTGGCRRR